MRPARFVICQSLSSGGVMAENDEVIALLREIRDLQKAQFARYQEVTSAALPRSQDATQKLAHHREIAEHHREIAEQHRVEANHNLAELRRSGSQSGSVFWVNTIFQAVLILTLWYMILRR